MNAISTYQDAVAEIKASITDAERLVRIITTASSALREWRKTMVSDVSGGFPPEIALLPSNPTISGRDWPTIQQLADALMRYHKAKQSLQNAYDAIPESERSVVQLPKTFF